MLSLANNHSLDFGEVGLEQTIDTLWQNDITPLENLRPTILGTSSGQLNILAYNLGDDEELLLNRIRDVAELGSRTIIYAHWGESEATEPVEYQRLLARDWIAAGADLVVGSGPHELQGAELINGVPVVYSLGNFIYDQAFNPEFSMVLKVVFEKDSITLLPSLISHQDSKPLLVRDQSASELIKTQFNDFAQHLSTDLGGVVYEIE